MEETKVENKGFVIENTEELKDKEVKQTGKKTSKVKKAVLATLLAAALLVGGYAGGNFIRDHFIGQQSLVMQEYEDLTEEITADGTDLALDLRKAGYEIDGKDALYFMLFARTDTLEEDYIRELNLSNVTERVITDSVDKTLIDAKEAIMAGHEVSIQDYFPNEKDQALLSNLFNIMSHWNKSDKKQVADAMLELNDYMFIKGQYQEYTPQAVVTYIKLFRGFDELTINSGYTLATEDMRKLIYIDQECYTEDHKIEGRSIHSEQYAVVKETLNEKFNGREYEKKYEEGLGYKIIQDINNRVLTSGVELGKKPDIQAERDKNNNVIYADNPASSNYVPPISEKEKSQIKVDPSTGEEYIFQPATEEEKQAQREQIEKEQNQGKNGTDAATMQKEWQSGHDKGFADGIEGKSKASMTGKSEYYVQGYEYGYGVGYDMYKASLEDDELVGETFIPSNGTNSGTNSSITTPVENPTTTPSTSSSSSFEFVDGFYESNGIVYDSDGNMLRDENGNPLTVSGSNNQKTNQK